MLKLETTIYKVSKTPKPNKVERLPPTSIPPSTIPGWIWDDVNKYYYKIKRGRKYIRINNRVFREDEYRAHIQPDPGYKNPRNF
jgi:hypothetical protein